MPFWRRIWALALAAVAFVHFAGPASAATDRSALGASLMSILEDERSGVARDWVNPSTGTTGKVTILRTFVRPDKVPCREFRAALKPRSSAPFTVNGVGCRSQKYVWILNFRTDSGSASGRAATPQTANDVSTETVRVVQRALSELGYDAGTPDGLYGPRTRSAIQRYQRDRGLVADGRITGPLMNQMSREITARKAPGATAGPRPRSSRVRTSTRSEWRGVDASFKAVPKTTEMSAVDTYRTVSDSVWVVEAGGTSRGRRGEAFSLGSAVAIDSTYLLTNCHIIEGRRSIQIQQDDDVRKARLVSADPRGDRCILAAESGRLTPAPGVRAFGDLKVGERVFTVGNPSGLERTLGEGIVSGLRSMGGQKYVQTTAPISKGSSGGGLFDAYGNLIGITTGYLGDAQLLNFAIAADEFWR